MKSAEQESHSDALVGEQIRAFRIISKIEQYNTPSVKLETALAIDLAWLGKSKHEEGLRSNEIYQWALDRLSEKYRAFGDDVKAQCLNASKNRQFYDNPEKMKALIALMDKPSKSEFEQFVLTVHPYSRADLFEYQAIGLIYQYKFPEALDKFEDCKGSGDIGLLADPFIVHINDCHDCDHESRSGSTYTKYSFTKRMAELQSFTSGDSKKLARNYFLLANGLYNMTYFGNARMVYDTKMKDHYLVEFGYDNGNKSLEDPIYDCSKAAEYYRKAMELSVDKEFKAKCCFMAAKCEQNAYFISADYSANRSIQSGKYFKLLQEDFSKTGYYKEVLKECGYFATYQAHWMLTHPE